jgi:MFS family permease
MTSRKKSATRPRARQGGLASIAAAAWRGLLPGTRALRHRNYRLFFAGQGLSLIGTWMQRVALGWLVYDLTRSAWLLGAVGFAGQIPTFLAAPLAGVLADRTDRRRLIVATQTLAMLQAFVLAGLTMAGIIETWHIIVLSVLLGVVNGFDIPIRQSFVVEMLESREDLPNAIAVNSFLVNGARLVGPSVAGVLIAAVGTGTCFLVNGVTFVAVIAALLAMRVKPLVRQAHRPHVLAHLGEGLVYAFGHAPIRAILFLLAVISLLGFSYAVLMPVFADDRLLGGGPRTLGFLMAAGGVGAMGGAVFLALRRSVRGLGRIMVLASLLFGGALVGFGFSRNLYLSLGLLAVAGFGMMIQFAASNSLIQTLVDDDKRGRVMSLYVMAFMGMGPFGSLLAGWLARMFGAPMAVALGGAGCIVAAGLFATRLPRLGRLVHPTYIRLGIVPDPGKDPNGDPLRTASPWETRL